ncbi:hypothetical protein M011DRAFT_180255 [Sporormia fimetaria CBS 119925]|uniref:Uncharacterized protein n=1 Tax=Sporormia fimetaria CBS 119925 TaxID=1340428 RepID=A0A6A6VLL2_9PLEO|nr:hypothetical protein M011DRAFT_180255 [Sporormia fimetaria CBS 119925]
MAPSRTITMPRDEAVAAASANPASLLWGHQLKREHTFLLKRMKEVEDGEQLFDRRIKAVEAAATAMKNAVDDVDRLAAQQNRIEETQKIWNSSMEERLRSAEEALGEMQGVQPRMTELEGQMDGLEEYVQKLVDAHTSVLKKVKYLEQRLSTSMAEANRDREATDGTEIRMLLDRLNAVESNNKEVEGGMKAMQDQISALERACRVYQAKNNELQARLDAVGEESAVPARPTEVPTQVIDSATFDYTPTAGSQFVDTQIEGAEDGTEGNYEPRPREVATQVVSSSPPAHLQTRMGTPVPQVRDESHSPPNESPLVDAQFRKKIRATFGLAAQLRRAPSYPRLQPQMNLDHPASARTQDLDAPYIRAHVPNSSKIRKALPDYVAPQTRSQVQLQVSQILDATNTRPSQIVVLKLPQKRRPTGSPLASWARVTMSRPVRTAGAAGARSVRTSGVTKTRSVRTSGVTKTHSVRTPGATKPVQIPERDARGRFLPRNKSEQPTQVVAEGETNGRKRRRGTTTRNKAKV